MAEQAVDVARSSRRPGRAIARRRSRRSPSGTGSRAGRGRRASSARCKAEVRDALWMLTRQWQLGEFRGDDAGSPFFAKLQLETSRCASTARARRAARAVRRRAAAGGAGRAAAGAACASAGGRCRSTCASLMGRQWLKLIAGIARLPRQEFIDALPDHRARPDDAGRRRPRAHPEAWQAFAAVAGRRMDGGALYLHLAATPAHHAYDGVAGVDPGDRPGARHAGRALRAPGSSACCAAAARRRRGRLGRRRAWSTASLLGAARPAARRCYVADEYHGGHLDWYGLRRRPRRRRASAATATRADVPPVPDDPLTLDPRPGRRSTGCRTRAGGPSRTGRTNFGDVDAATTDLAKLLFLEFGLVYANDWFLVPLQLPAGSVADVRGLAVTNVFGERTWIEAAGAGPDDDWQRWSMFTVSVQGRRRAAGRHQPAARCRRCPRSRRATRSRRSLLIRDEMANMVWGVERTIPLPSGDAKRGAEAGRETLRLPHADCSAGRSRRADPAGGRRALPGDDERAGAVDPVRAGPRARRQARRSSCSARRCRGSSRARSATPIAVQPRTALCARASTGRSQAPTSSTRRRSRAPARWWPRAISARAGAAGARSPGSAWAAAPAAARGRAGWPSIGSSTCRRRCRSRARAQCATSTTIRVGAVSRKTRKPVLRRSPSP